MTIESSRWYSKQGLWSLFLMCAFPVHVWAILLIFNDFAWVAERTNAWDAVGVGSYGLVFAFIESIILFLIAVLLGFLVSRKWDEKRRVALMAVLVLVTSLWAILGQAYFLLKLSFSLPPGWIHFIGNMDHPVRFMSAIAMGLIALTILPPAYMILKSDKALRFTLESMDRISLLTMFYLCFDSIGLVIVIVRNLA